MYKEPWFDISEYPEEHKLALETELKKELGSNHSLFGKRVNLLAKREDRDDLLLKSGSTFYIVHLTWIGVEESSGYPLIDAFETELELEVRLTEDSLYF
ncbi:hypothetical protein [Vibrio nigripulchritudo]|uniref:hypothetical protein n=1 Tax=Vibrio nigripulchritudo TaxID=28173 RepID=UPI0005F9CAF8|nr:hypothetical protein [Vibrio nigripulchritudo]KJY74755.1 hypothetical protein TW74_18785 [Vibrio nigripulchritudo]